MSANEKFQLPSDALPFRQGALDAEAIRAECPQFRILIIGKPSRPHFEGQGENRSPNAIFHVPDRGGDHCLG